uniref:Uncharacterized protein n=1 Tax=Lygus hesperus TaxID=30085 RepID=A0A146L8H9_LYGHE
MNADTGANDSILGTTPYMRDRGPSFLSNEINTLVKDDPSPVRPFTMYLVRHTSSGFVRNTDSIPDSTADVICAIHGYPDHIVSFFFHFFCVGVPSVSTAKVVLVGSTVLYSVRTFCDSCSNMGIEVCIK